MKNFYSISLPLLLLLSATILSGCVSSSNFYSARTLEQNKLALTFGADDIVMKPAGNLASTVSISKDLPFAPSIGLYYGLPLRLETGIRWYPIRFLEASLREQLNPRSFNTFDASIDLSYAGMIGAYSYLRYGVTVSKDINNIEPFIHYSFYQATGRMTSVSSNTNLDGFITDLSSSLINSSRVIGFGVGLPLKKIKFFPEADYQYYNGDLSQGIWHLGVGIRIYTN